MSSFTFRIPKHRRVAIDDDGAYQPAVTRKRRRKTNDLHFLDTELFPDSQFLVPSSDLLKSIHHLASSYYTDRGQLFNDSRTFRQQQLARRKAKKARKSLDDEENDSEKEPPSREDTTRRRDMYKTMDGSALLAIGMLLQEHVSRALATRIPSDWKPDAPEVNR
ncbi:hypothetical protein MIND_00340200 [Mycena indigotica]|uniref:Uncharacterized protein n=1 Tax=Mycena indigotica TaxID=2126181 RepID=A0A8H6T0Z8_9AGAR|nr:uncharacterized protein MIND_00340200 [Mycena indigotica]KAF7309688.1 hypothetical protein MIND_00340200 [Mycena indigotica]